MRSFEDFWQKIEWEGGIDSAVNYGMPLDEYDLPPEFRKLWEQAELILDDIRAYMPDDVEYDDETEEAE